MSKEVVLIDRDELLKHEVMIITKGNAAFHGVPSSLIETAPVIDLKNLREKLKWYEDAGIPVIPDYGLSTIRRAINRYGTTPQLQMAIEKMSELTKAICKLQRTVTFDFRNGAKIKVAHESVRQEIADVYVMLAQLMEIIGKPEEVQQIVLEKLERLEDRLNGGEVRSE